MSGLKHTQETSIDRLYPDLPADERAKIEHNLGRYIEIVSRVYDRNGPKIAKLLTENPKLAKVRETAREIKPANKTAALS